MGDWTDERTIHRKNAPAHARPSRQDEGGRTNLHCARNRQEEEPERARDSVSRLPDERQRATSSPEE
jgi:hypothetical protein